MSEPAWGPVRRELVRLAGGAGLAALADADLLALFAESRRAEAFTEIVHRYGSQVYGVCRRGLRSPADADDAFQATFLVLARCARAVRRGPSLAGWLHGIARRVVARAHRDAARR